MCFSIQWVKGIIYRRKTEFKSDVCAPFACPRATWVKLTHVVHVNFGFYAYPLGLSKPARTDIWWYWGEFSLYTIFNHFFQWRLSRSFLLSSMLTTWVGPFALNGMIYNLPPTYLVLNLEASPLYFIHRIVRSLLWLTCLRSSGQSKGCVGPTFRSNKRRRVQSVWHSTQSGLVTARSIEWEKKRN